MGLSSSKKAEMNEIFDRNIYLEQNMRKNSWNIFKTKFYD